MAESTDTQTPRPNEFAISKDTAYAVTDVEIWEIIEYLVTKLRPVRLEDLDPDDRVCSICQEELLGSEDVSPSHAPVKIMCGHIFGRKCIIRWLNPLCTWEFLINHQTAHPDQLLYANSSCPMCRADCVPEVVVEAAELVACRLCFWDMAYASAGVARSEREERSRASLVKHIIYCRSIYEDKTDEEWDLDLFKVVQDSLLGFVESLKRQTLTAEQERLRKRLERIGRKDLAKCPFANEAFAFNIDSDDNERAEFANQPLE